MPPNKPDDHRYIPGLDDNLDLRGDPFRDHPSFPSQSTRSSGNWQLRILFGAILLGLIYMGKVSMQAYQDAANQPKLAPATVSTPALPPDSLPVNQMPFPPVSQASKAQAQAAASSGVSQQAAATDFDSCLGLKKADADQHTLASHAAMAQACTKAGVPYE